MLFEIKSRFDGRVLFSLECGSLKLCAEAAVKSRANLSRANLSGANLSRANLSRANLSGANLFGANLSAANLFDANLSGAHLFGANLSRANLSGANLSGANLSGANLSRANLFDANLSGANLSGANLFGANLSGANLFDANLSGANLSGAKNIPPIAIAKTRILPEGSIIGWKKGSKGEIIKLRIPEEARRSHAFGRKCRAEFADVLEISNGADTALNGTHDKKIEYRVGARVHADKWDEDFSQECSNGIHFFITREEAEEW